MRVLYVEGDACASKYVEGPLSRAGIEATTRVDEPLREDPADYDLCILSDVPADRLGKPALEALAEAVAAGTGLLLVGGWRSYGRGGYADTFLANLLPVQLEAGDDRMNLPSGAYPLPLERHPILDGIDFNAPPVLTGYNRCRPRADARVIMEGVIVGRVHEDRADLTGHAPFPLLAVGHHGDGRIACFTSDLAPHWSGGLTDWGPGRVDVGRGQEVGTHYLRFLAQLCAWTAARPVPPQMQRVEARH